MSNRTEKFTGFHIMNPFLPSSYFQPETPVNEIQPYVPHYSIPQATTRKRIQHIVLFSLRPKIDPVQTKKFLSKAKQVLSSLPGVHHFRILRQVNPENEYPFALTMEFSHPSFYEAYKSHPTHLRFIEKHWNKNVERYFITDLQAC